MFAARLRRGGARALELQREFVAVGQFLKRGLGGVAALDRLVARGGGAREALVQRGQARQRLRATALGGGEFVPGGVVGGAGVARALARLGLARGGLAQRALRLRGLELRFFGGLARGFRLALEIAEPVLFREPAGGGRRRFGGGDEAVPAPEVAFARDEALAGFQERAEPLPSSRVTTPICASLRPSAAGAST